MGPHIWSASHAPCDFCGQFQSALKEDEQEWQVKADDSQWEVALCPSNTTA